MADALYYHSSLYAFDGAALEDIIGQFHAQVLDVTVKCWYDTTEDTFCLTCPPGDIGPQADGVLGSIIRKYTGEAAAPGATRFWESDLDQLDATLTEPSTHSAVVTTDAGSDHVLEGASQSHAQEGPRLPLLSHCLLVGNSTTSHVQFFNLRQLPCGHLERTLSSLESAARNAVGYAFTARLVRWNGQQYVFNGRNGSAIVQSDLKMPQVFESTKFKPMQDRRLNVPPIQEQESVVSTANEWRSERQQSTIHKYLADIGETELVDPNSSMPEMPADTRRLMAQPISGPIATAGRARVPKASIHSHSKSSEDESVANYSDDEEPNSVQQAQAFANLLGGPLTKDADVEPISKYGSDDEDEDDGGGQGNFAELLSGPSKQAQAPNQSQGAIPKSQMKGVNLKTNTSHPMEAAVTPPLSTIMEQSGNAESSLPTYMKKYATVDRHGLKSVASLQAEWEQENLNLSPKKRKASKSGIASRRAAHIQSLMSPPPTENDSTTMSLSSGQDPSTFQSPRRQQISSHSSSLSQTRTPPRVQNYGQTWVGRTPPRCVPEGMLIDVDANELPTTIKPQPPPGSDMGQEAHVPLSPLGSACGPLQTPAQHVSNLIDFNEDDNSEPPIIERLEPPQDEPIRRYTMRQQKGKKRAGGSHHKKGPPSNKSAVSLPKPDLLPTPRPKAKSQSKAAELSSTSPKSLTTALENVIPPRESQPDAPTIITDDEDTTNSREKPVNYVASFLRSIFDSGGNKDIHVTAHLGVILARHKADKGYFNGTYIAAKAEEKLRSAVDDLETDFLSRMTTSATDAEAMLYFFPGDRIDGKMIYDMHVKTLDGDVCVIRFAPEARNDFEAYDEPECKGKAYLHYPMHVFDAQIIVEHRTHDPRLEPMVTTLLDSFQTVGDLPSFQGLDPRNCFTIDKIFAKRTFTKYSANGLRMVVTEVQDLFIEPINSEYYNFRAKARSTDVMIQEQRFWYEACIEVGSARSPDIDMLQDAVDKIVSQLDGVGCGNQGPWMRIELPPPKKDPLLVDWVW